MDYKKLGLDRREFLAAAMTPLAASKAAAQTRRLSPRTLFFNLAHEHIAATSHFLYTNGRFYRLTRTVFDPSVLKKARMSSAFLRAVPDSQITHHCEGILISEEMSTLGYVGANENPSTGTWSMSMIVQHLPTGSISSAYRKARLMAPTGPLPLSAKRFRYGHPAAMTMADLQEEQVLVDSTDHARTLIGLHADLVCADAQGASHIHTNYISTNSRTRFLASILTQKGPADPQQTAGQPNSRGWATMIPINQDDGQPFKNSQGLNQYFPDWDSTVDQQMAGAVTEIHPQVKNDATLGSDVTAPPDAPQSGKVWYRSDGQSFVARSSSPLQDAPSLAWAWKDLNGAAGLKVTQPTVNANGGSVTVTLNNVNNWFLRFLGMWLQFQTPNGTVIPVSQLPVNTIPSRNGTPNPLDKADVLFAGVVPPPFSVAGIPVAPGSFAVTLNMPPDAGTLQVFYAGIGHSGSRSGPDGINGPGVGLTIAVNYGLVALFMAVGVSTIDPVIKLCTGVIGQIMAQELIVAITVSGLDNGTPNNTQSALAFLKGLLNGVAGKVLTNFTNAVLEEMAASEIIDSVPAVGQVARAVAAVIGAVQLAETSIEVAISPAVYEFDLVLTHDINVTILPDPNNNQFPQVPSGYTLYYKISYLFDNASAHVMDAVDVPDPSVASIPVTLSALPRGGLVNVLVGFYSRQSTTPAGQNDWCAGNGSTGLVDNTKSDPLTITIKQVKVPITSSTRYIHTRKTMLNSSGGHQWVNTSVAPPYVPPSGGQQPGSMGAFRSITVRQGTLTQQGYVGYSWQAYSRTLNDCTAGSPGQLDQAANLNTDAGNGGANAQNGYATTSCGLQGGATSGLRLAYSLINDDAANYYLDTSSLLVRQVQLNPPSFASPTQGFAVAQLNMDSTRLLLHPAGHVVSINNANHKLETARLPSAPVADADAKANLLARTHAGQGSRPGLMTSPVAAAISPEGVILILEDSSANNRLQAFDLGGNPVPFFKGQPVPYFLQLAATQGATYLDVAIEYTGYVYILSQAAEGAAFRLDIYHPTQTDTNPISTTMGVSAAKLTVDFWRSVYTLNYEVLQLPGGAIPNITEPSVSLWVPSEPS